MSVFPPRDDESLRAVIRVTAEEVANPIVREIRAAVDEIRSLLVQQPAPRQGPSKVDDESIYRVGPIVVDVARHEVTYNGKLIPLKPREFALLAALASNAGRVLSRAQCLDLAWPQDAAFTIEGERTVDVHIRRLRRALGDGSRRIETIEGIGYRLSDRDETI